MASIGGSNTLEQHISNLWPVLTRNPQEREVWSSLIPLPEQYVVPGGRFREIYYWDSYFTMLGLAVDGRDQLIESMLNNFSFLIDTLGFIPNGNRTYYLGRSQTPFFSLMVKLWGNERGAEAMLPYADALEEEYEFWMDGHDQLKKSGDREKRVVKMPDGSIMNRYWDDFAQPRPESFKEDVHAAHESDRSADIVYRDLRARAESGWDYSCRWLTSSNQLSTIETTSIIPVDLNSLLYHLEILLHDVNQMLMNLAIGSIQLQLLPNLVL